MKDSLLKKLVIDKDTLEELVKERTGEELLDKSFLMMTLSPSELFQTKIAVELLAKTRLEKKMKGGEVE